MAVVGWRRVLEGTEVSGKVGESMRIVEKWEVRVDSPATNKLLILGAVPCGYNSAHWEFTDCKAQEFSLSPNNRTGMIWTLSVTFYIPERNKDLDEAGIPKDYWECSGGTTMVPAFRDKDGNIIVNAAKDPVEGLEKEREEESWTLTKYYTDDSWKADRDSYAGRVNSTTFSGDAALKWKCYFKGAKQKEIQDVDLNATASDAATGSGGSSGTLKKRTIVETVWEFRREPDTWKAMPWDIGFQEIVGGVRKVIMDEGTPPKPVRQPVALNSDGTKKSPGTAPAVINSGNGVELYLTADLAGKFGTPHIIPA